MSLSYRKQLKEIGETGSRISYRDFFVVRNRLSETMEAMTSPRPEKWTLPYEHNKTGPKLSQVGGFLEDCQGVTHDNKHWYFISNGSDYLYHKTPKGLYKFDQNLKLVDSLIFNEEHKVHLGDPDYYERKIYIPVQNKQNKHGFLVVDLADPNYPHKLLPLESGKVSFYKADDLGDSHPWCAVNPWNGRLYTSKFNGENINKFDLEQKLYAYNRITFKREEKDDIILELPSQRVQGGCFTEDGKLYLSSDARKFKNPNDNLPKYNKVNRLVKLEPSITCYSIINGHFYGKIIPIKRDAGLLYDQEVEGLTYWAKKEKGYDTHLHVVLLEKTANTDGMYFKHYAAPK